MEKSLKPVRKCAEIGWFLANIICSLGVCLSAKSGFGVSMVVAPAFVLHKYLSQFSDFFTFGNTEYLVQGLFIISLMIIFGKFKIKYPLAFVTSVIYGLTLDGWRLIFGQNIPDQLYIRIIYMVLGAIVTALAIAIYLRTCLPQQGYDLFVYELATEKKKKMNVVKWIYDASSLVFAIILMLILFQRFDLEMVGVGTLILTLVNTPLIAAWGKLLDRFIDFSPLFPKVAKKLFGYTEDDDKSTEQA